MSSPVAVSLSSTQAIAVPYYPGSQCQVSNPSAVDTSSGRLTNISDATITVSCPVPVEYISSNSTFSYQGLVYVYAVDQHYSNNVTCTLSTYDKSGKLSRASTSVTTKDSSGSVQSMAPVVNSMIEGSATYAVLKCNIPGVYSGNTSYISTYSGIYPMPYPQ